MSRYRLHLTIDQEQQVTLYCSHARYVWNVALEQMNYGVPGRRMPGFAEQSRQLTEARHEHDWLREVPIVVGQQALRDFRQACTNWWGGTHRRPTWRRKGQHEGFRIVGLRGHHVRTLNRKWSAVWVPRIGWVKFRRTRDVPDAKSYRITRDAAGRWHISFAVKPEPIEAPGNREVVGVDRGIAVTLAYSDGTLLRAPQPVSIRASARALSRCKRGSNRRRRAKKRLAQVHAGNADRRKDFVEKATTGLARRFDLIRVERLAIGELTKSARGDQEEPGKGVQQKAGLNRGILSGAWGEFVTLLESKAPGRVEKIDPAFTSQTCAVCRHVDRNSRKSQALFCCTSCGHTANADVNAAQVIAAGRAVRGAEKSSASKRVPQRSGPRVA